MYLVRSLALLSLVCSFLIPTAAFAAEFIHAEVREVISEEETVIPGTDTESFLQILRAELETGEVVTVENDRILLEVGDAFFAGKVEAHDQVIYSVVEPDRRGALILSVLVFSALVIVVGRWKGLRALIALGVSLALIFLFLLPRLLDGGSPVVTSTITAIVILALVMAITHGINRATLAAFFASIITIVFAVSLGEFFVTLAHISGFATDASVILNLSTGGSLRMEGIFLGALIIGTLGIIDDLTVTQVSTVSELRQANTDLSSRELYRRAMRVGRDHLGSVVNTLVLAYAGAALPLLLLATLSVSSFASLLNSEVLATEIIRNAVGGGALALALPIATAFGVIAARMGAKPVGHTH